MRKFVIIDHNLLSYTILMVKKVGLNKTEIFSVIDVVLWICHVQHSSFRSAL